MNLITAPSYEPVGFPSVFLAGGIIDCPEWQGEIIAKLSEVSGVTVLNPRRADWTPEPGDVEKQIKWEYQRIRQADLVAFWFPFETVCPIALYELGCCLFEGKRVLIGMHPEYPRREDVEIQVPLVRPSVPIVNSLDDLALAIITNLETLAPRPNIED